MRERGLSRYPSADESGWCQRSARACLGLPLSAPLPAWSRGLFHIDEGSLFANTSLPLGQKAVQFPWVKVAELFLLVECQDGRGDNRFGRGVFAGSNPLLNELLHVRRQ